MNQTVAPQPHDRAEEARVEQATIYLNRAFDAYIASDTQAALTFEQRAFTIMGSERRLQFGRMLRYLCTRLLTAIGRQWLPQAQILLRRARNLMPNSARWVEEVLADEADHCQHAGHQIGRDDALLTFYYLRCPRSLVLPDLEAGLRAQVGNDAYFVRLAVRRTVILATAEPRRVMEATFMLDGARHLLYTLGPSQQRSTATVEVRMASAILRHITGDNEETVRSLLLPVREWVAKNNADPFFTAFYREQTARLSQRKHAPARETSSSQTLPIRKVHIPQQGTHRRLVITPQAVVG